MPRHLTILGALASAMLVATPAAAQRVADYQPAMSAGNMREGTVAIFHHPARPGRLRPGPGRLDWRDLDQARRWALVGRCVARSDRAGSVAWLASAHDSVSAKAAYERLDPAFDACFAGSGAVSRGVASYRRAALADALGIRAPA